MLKSFSNALRRLHKELSTSWIFICRLMKLIIFFIYIPFVYSASHTLMTTYKGLNGQVVAGTPEFSAVTTLDEQEIDYYDSETGKLIPRQDWMKEFASGDRWKQYTEIRERVQQINKINITVLMEQFSQSHGVHMYKRKYGCVWDDETGVTDGLDEYSYDGQHFISLDLKEGRYTAHVPQAEPTVLKWKNDRSNTTFDFLKQYYKHECIDWLKEFLHFSRATFKKTDIVAELPGKSLTEPTENQTDSIKPASCGLVIMLLVILILVITILITLQRRKNLNKPGKDEHIYSKTYPSSNPSDEPASPDNLEKPLIVSSG